MGVAIIARYGRLHKFLFSTHSLPSTASGKHTHRTTNTTIYVASHTDLPPKARVRRLPRELAFAFWQHGSERVHLQCGVRLLGFRLWSGHLLLAFCEGLWV